MIGLLTIDPHIYNYGGFLQEMALQDTIKLLGYDCEVINYNVSQEFNTFSIKRGITNFSITKIIDKFMAKRKTNLTERELKLINDRRNAFDKYREDKILLSKQINYKELRETSLGYDCIICGSDQIWNPDYNIPAFFLDFAGNNVTKVIYAASIGRNSLTKKQLNTYKKLIKNIDYVSVREKSAQNIIKKIYNKNVYLVLDPTLLPEIEYWDDITSSSDKKYKRYLFCYFLNPTDDKISATTRFAKAHGLSIVTIPYLTYDQDENFGDIQDPDVNPADFIKIIKDADVVITDSFHATVFSCIFNKCFWVFGRNSGSYSMNTRIHTLLGYYNIMDRMIRPEDLYDAHIANNSYSKKNIDALRNESYEYLINAINNR